ncbi:MAG TPA: hypothetical protein VFO39_02175 [Candidatus Sulfotelmatobacter sp.]|nr:hypothetical protein [Candidatus Sulfotelmatobacter sp.]
MLESFATKYKLKLKRSLDDNGEYVINGKSGQIYEYSDCELAVCFTPGLNKDRGIGTWCPRRWSNLKRSALATGMTLRQNGDSEGSLSFDPDNRQQAKLAIKIAAVRPKRVLSPEHKAKLLAASPLLQRRANSPILNDHLSA